ncbi:dihydropteroate synthase [bacterium]|nr:dihydropteroate synthase [bacterium]
MKLIGENLHIISKSVRTALLNRDEKFIVDLIKKQSSMNLIDLNVGPANSGLDGILAWLANLVQNNSNLHISFDTANVKEMRKGLEVCNDTKHAFINSASDDIERLEKMTDLAAEFDTNLIALTLSSKTGIPKTADGRVELALDIYETCMAKGISNDRIYFDPLILPVSVDQSQLLESLNTIKILKESFEPACNTVIGLSNISNGSPKELRPLINKVCLALAYGAGLDVVILDATDNDLINLIHMLDSSNPKSEADKLLLDLTSVTRDFCDINDIEYNNADKASSDIYKAAQILLNKNIYSHSFTQV